MSNFIDPHLILAKDGKSKMSIQDDPEVQDRKIVTFLELDTEADDGSHKEVVKYMDLEELQRVYNLQRADVANSEAVAARFGWTLNKE